MLICITIRLFLIFFCNVTAFHCANTDLGFREPFCFFLFAALHIGLFPSTKMWIFLGWKIFQIYPSESRLVLYGNFYLFFVFHQRMQDFCIIWICSFNPNLKSASTSSAMALHVLFLPQPDFDWTTSSSSLMLLKGEFTTYVSLSEISQKLPMSQNHSQFHLFYQFWKKFFL